MTKLDGRCVVPADGKESTPHPLRLPIPPADEHAYVQVSECFGWASEEAWRFFEWLYAQNGLAKPSRRASFLPPYGSQQNHV